MADISYINKDLVMEGTLESKEGQIVIAGQFKGNITAKSVVIENSAHVQGNVNSEHLKVEGKISPETLLQTFWKYLVQGRLTVSLKLTRCQ